MSPLNAASLLPLGSFPPFCFCAGEVVELLEEPGPVIAELRLFGIVPYIPRGGRFSARLGRCSALASRLPARPLALRAANCQG